jgi:translation initiation factor IF-2
MPVRIYDIAKKLGLESKVVLVKAKDLGIAAAKVPSSSLDKITAEYLEQQLAPLAPPPPPPAQEPVPVVIVSAPVEAPPAAPPPEAAPLPPAEEVSLDAGPVEAAPPEQAPAPETPKAEPAPVAPPAPSLPPPPSLPPAPMLPPKPQLGEKIGWIDLGPRARPAGRTAESRGGREATRDGSNRAPAAPARGTPAARPAPPPVAGKPAAPVAPKVSVAADAPLIMMKPPIIVRDLAERMGKKPFQVIADLMGMGAFVTVNQTIDTELAVRVCAKNNFRFETEKRQKDAHVVNVPKDQELVLDQDDKIEELKPRPPVITIMGHVDHGKTTLLDVIRKANVAAGEAGGITQHIGAYTIQYPHPTRKEELMQLTFLDTPGHAAFSAMRARGANVTDIVVLVVAANDGVMPQTLEALAHAQAAKVPIIVAVNKCDHPNANPMKVRQQLQEKGLVPDDWGGDTLYVDCSAVTKQGVDKLIDAILLQAELMELKANPNRRAKGNVIESGVEPGGPVATVLVRKGTLHVGDVIICGEFYGKVRAMMDEEDGRLKEATPSVAVRVLGLNGVPEAGSEFSAVENERAARDEAETRFSDRKKTELEGVRPKRQTLEDMFGQISDLTAKVLKVIVKADTQGSVEAICDALRKFESDKVSLDIIHNAVGAITEYDVLLAASANAVILGFHTRVDSSAAEAAKREGVQIKLYAIIYELIDQVKEAMAGLLDPLLKEVTVGQAEVRKIFELSKGGRVAGCYVSNGKLLRGKMRVRRKGHVVYEGVSLTLKRFQDEVNEVRSGMECGVRLDGFDEIQEGDLIECYTTEKVAQKL